VSSKILITLILCGVFGLSLSAKDLRVLCKEQQFCVFETLKGELPMNIYFKHSFGNSFLENFGSVLTNDGWKWINTRGETIEKPTDLDFLRDYGRVLESVSIGDKYGYINASGKLVIPATFDSASYFTSNGLAYVRLGKKYGYINTKGDIVIPAEFDDANDFASNGLALVKIDGKFGYINSKGKIVIPAIYDYARNFADNGLALVQVNDRKKYINSQGTVAIEKDFENCWNFTSSGLAAVKIGGKIGFMNSKGTVVIPPKYDTARNYEPYFNKGLSRLSLNGEVVYINEKGQEHNSNVYKALKSASNGDEFLLIMSFNSKSPQQLYLEAGKLERNGDSYKSKMIYNYIVDNYPDSDFAVKSSDKLTGASRAENEESNRKSQNRHDCQNNKNSCLAGCGTYISGADSHNNSVWSCNDRCNKISCY